MAKNKNSKESKKEKSNSLNNKTSNKQFSDRKDDDCGE